MYDDTFHNINDSLEQVEKMLLGESFFFLDVQIFEDVINYYSQIGDVKKAYQVCELALKQHPYTLEILLQKALLIAEDGNPEKALKTLEIAENIYPSDFDLKFHKGKIIELVDVGKSIEIFEQLLSESGSKKPEITFQLAKLYFKAEKYEIAQRFFHKTIEIHPEEGDFIQEYLVFAETTQNVPKAVSFFQKQTDASPYNKYCWYNLGMAYTLKEDYEKASQAFEYATLIDIDFDYAYFGWGLCLFEGTQYQKAVEKLLLVKELEQELELNLLIGLCYKELKVWQKALKYLRKGLAVDPNHPEILFNIGVCFFHQNTWLESIHYFNKAIKANESIAEYWEYLAEAEKQMGNFFSAEEAFQKAIDLSGDNPITWLSWSELYFNNQMVSDAVDVLTDALEELPDNADLLYRVAAYYLILGKLFDACKYLEQALILNYQAHTQLWEIFQDPQKQGYIKKIINQLHP